MDEEWSFHSLSNQGNGLFYVVWFYLVNNLVMDIEEDFYLRTLLIYGFDGNLEEFSHSVLRGEGVTCSPEVIAEASKEDSLSPY